MHEKTDATVVIRQMSDEGNVSWNSLITGHAENGLGKELDKCFQRMQLDYSLPDAMTCAGLKACGCIKDSTAGQEMYFLIMKIGLDLSPNIGDSLVDMCIKCGLIVEAHCVVHLLPTHTTVSWNILSQACLTMGSVKKYGNGGNET